MADDVIEANAEQKKALAEHEAGRVTGGKGDNILARTKDDTYIEIAQDGSVTEAEAPKERQALEQVGGSAITVPARLGFDQQQVVAIRNTVAADCNNAELVMFLEVAARYELDPFARQIYAAKMKGRVQIIVSRDGLLAHAHKEPSFVRMDGDVVHANDEFSNVFENGERSIKHSYSTQSDPSKSGPNGEPVGRGPIIGAWARVVREGHGETYFFAPMGEYKQDREGPWQKTPSAMILKCAETYALRKAFSISGVVGEDEIEKERKMLTDVETGKTRELAFSNIDFGPEPRASYIATLAEMANQLKPGSYRPAKLQALAADPEALVNELASFIAELGGEAPPEPIDGDAVEIVGEEGEGATVAAAAS
jgi:phage recombination protein Bet